MDMSLELSIVLVGLLWGSSLGVLAWIACAQSREISKISKAILHNQLANLALEASKKTNTMLGPAVLQQLKEEKQSGTTNKKEKPRSGVTVRY